MKALLLTDVFPPKTGGSGRWFWEIYRRLPREEFVVVAGEDPRQSDFDATHDLSIARVKLRWGTWGTASLRGLRGYLSAYRAVGRIARQYDCDRLHCGTLLPEGWIAWILRKRHGWPYLVYIHGEELNVGSRSRELGWMMRRVLRGADRVIANSRNTSRILQEQWHVAAERLRILNPGVDIDRFVPASRDPAVRAALGWDDRLVVLTVGRLQKRKGQDQMIRALDAIRGTIPNVLYAVVGDGDERADLQRLVRALDMQEHVQFRGETSDEDLIRSYQQCDLFALPNREIGGDIEGFGMVLLEAQACGKPVVAGDSGGTAETMHVPATGRIVPCDGPGQLAAVVLELLRDPALRERMGQAARRWAVERFGWEPLSRQARQLLQGREASAVPEFSVQIAAATLDDAPSRTPASQGRATVEP